MEINMQTKIAKWGNSHGVRLPADILSAAGLVPGADVRLVLTARGVLIEPAAPRYSLAELLAQITPANTPPETDFGVPVGLEILE